MALLKNLWHDLRVTLRRLRASETLLWLMLLCGCVVVSPFVLRQFYSLEKRSDVVWNAAFDLMIAFGVMLVFILLAKLVRKFEFWLDRRD